MSEAQEFARHVVDLLDSFGPCEARRMFGGFGIFHQDQMFALIADGELYFKADDQSRELFIDTGSDRFTYYKQGKPFQLSYYRAPDAFFEQPDETLHWARIAFDAALRNPTPRKRKKGAPS